MELCYLKGNALDTLKSSLTTTFEKYLTERDNSWVNDVCGENPFVKFRDVPDFELEPLDADLDIGEIDFRNSKILYKNLYFLTPRQAADERFWVGFCHGAFYDYVRRRWGYDKINNLSGVDKGETIKRILNRFFFDGGSREKLLTNTLSKYWWTGHIFSREALDILGSKDFYTKLFSIVSRSFIGNKILRNGFVKFLRYFKDRGTTLEIDKHIRPAMSELNKRGGAIVLDCLTEADIAAIMIEHVEKILSHKNPRTVKMNSRVKVVSLSDGKTHFYNIDRELEKDFSDVYGELIGKTIGSTVTLRDGKSTITDIQ